MRHLSLLFDPTPIKCLVEETYFSKPLETVVTKGIWVLLLVRKGVVGNDVQKSVLVLWGKLRSIWFQTSLDTAGVTLYPWRTSLLCVTHLSKREVWLLFGVAAFGRTWEDRKTNKLENFAVCIAGVWQLFWKWRSVGTCRQLGRMFTECFKWLKDKWALILSRGSCAQGIYCNLKSIKCPFLQMMISLY